MECGGASGGGGRISDRDGFTGAGPCAAVLELEELAGGQSLLGLCWSSSRLRPRLGSLHRAASQMAVIWTRGEYVHGLEVEVKGDVAGRRGTTPVGCPWLVPQWWAAVE